MSNQDCAEEARYPCTVGHLNDTKHSPLNSLFALTKSFFLLPETADTLNPIVSAPRPGYRAHEDLRRDLPLFGAVLAT